MKPDPSLLIQTALTKLKKLRRYNHTKCTPKGGRSPDDDAINLAYELMEIWEDMQIDIDNEGEEYKEAVREVFNEQIDNSDDLGDILLGDDPNELLDAIKNLDSIARE